MKMVAGLSLFCGFREVLEVLCSMLSIPRGCLLCDLLLFAKPEVAG